MPWSKGYIGWCLVDCIWYLVGIKGGMDESGMALKEGVKIYHSDRLGATNTTK